MKYKRGERVHKGLSNDQMCSLIYELCKRAEIIGYTENCYIVGSKSLFFLNLFLF